MPIVVATKLHIPATRTGHIPRRALVDLLAEAEGARLVLVAAPPGSGKTTLLAEWSATALGTAFAWLSLDAEDSDPVQFWTCAIAALRTVHPEVGKAAEAALRAPGTSVTRSVLPLLINELAALERPMVLVLDDYHLIDDPDVHEALAYLLDHQPPSLQVAVATRSDPPFPLGRMRARAQLLELRGADLRFSGDEAEGFLNGALGLGLGPDDVARLHVRTEGWAAGLQLAGLSLRGRPGAEEFIASFTGDDRQLVDYLGTEVLDAQPPELRTFLRRTAILDRMSAPLCDAVTGRADSAAALRDADRANLFLVALDERREWFRYHHLFAELLRHDLAQAEPEAVPELHRRAAAWLREQGDVPEAVHHALEAGDAEEAAELVAAHWSTYFNRGRLATVARWLAALPPETVAADSRLWLARVWTSIDRGRLDEAAPLIASGPAGEEGPDPWVAVLTALHRFKSGDAGAAQAALRGALAEDVDPPAFRRTVALCVLGMASYWRGDCDEARNALIRAREVALGDHNGLGGLYATGCLALLAIDDGDLDGAEGIVAEGNELIAEEPGLDEHFIATIIHVAAGRLRMLRDDHAGAAAELERAVEVAGRGASVIERAAALLGLAEALRAGHEIARARGAVDEAASLVARAEDAGRLPELLDAARQVTAGRSARATAGDEALSERELAVLRLLPTAMSQREIGSTLYVSLNTVKSHTRRIFAKLGAANREEAVARARERGLI
jgi:LuxR family maltose regulon positive regulatory protein